MPVTDMWEDGTMKRFTIQWEIYNGLQLNPYAHNDYILCYGHGINLHRHVGISAHHSHICCPNMRQFVWHVSMSAHYEAPPKLILS